MRRLTLTTGWHAAKKISGTRVQSRPNDQELLAMFWQLRHMRALTLHDHVFAALRLRASGDMHSAQSDHSMGLSITRKMFSMLALKRGNSLENLSVAASSDNDLGKYGEPSPSWTINFDIRQRQRSKPLVLGVFAWPTQLRMYSSLGHDLRFTTARLIEDEQDTTKLYLTGFAFYSVAKKLVINTPAPPPLDAKFDPHKSPDLLNEAIRHLFQRIGRQTKFYGRSMPSFGTYEPSVKARWRTLLADQWPMGQRLGDGLFMDYKLPSTDEEEGIFLNEVDLDHYDLPFIQGRAVIVTQLGCLGLAPDTTRSGDQVFMLAGGQVPYVLRRQNDGCYELVGEW